MTNPDPILTEIYEIRAAISEKHGGDLRAILADARRRQGSKTVVAAAAIPSEGDNHAMHTEPPIERVANGERPPAAR